MIPRALALASGALLAASFPKYGHPAIAWIALAPLLVAVRLSAGRNGLRVFTLGWLAGAIYFGGTVYWVVGVMQRYGDLPVVVAAMIGALLVSYLAIYPALFALGLGWLIHRMGPGALWTAPALWVVTEWLRGTIGGGFPWVPLGASQASVVPVVQTASVVGVYGLSALLAVVSVVAALSATSSGRSVRRAGLVVALGVAAIMAAGTWRVVDAGSPAQAPLRVGLVQGNVAQDEKYDPRYADVILKRYIDLSRQAVDRGARLVVWPEAATPFYLDADGGRAAPLRRLVAETKTPFIIGTDEYQPAANGVPDRSYNAAALVGPDGRTRGSYRKIHLVPFGEFVPFKSLLFFVGPLIEAVSDFAAGTEPTVFDTGVVRASVAICYESVFPALTRQFVDRGSELLVTITNDAWFGRSSAAYQHFELGALRAVEQGRYLVRAANTGITGAVDPYGRVLARSDLFEPDVITVDVEPRTARTIYGRIGDVVVWASMAMVIWMLAEAARRGTSSRA